MLNEREREIDYEISEKQKPERERGREVEKKQICFTDKFPMWKNVISDVKADGFFSDWTYVQYMANFGIVGHIPCHMYGIEDGAGCKNETAILQTYTKISIIHDIRNVSVYDSIGCPAYYFDVVNGLVALYPITHSKFE